MQTPSYGAAPPRRRNRVEALAYTGPDRCLIYGRESPTNAVERAKAAGRQTPFDTMFAACFAHAAQRDYVVLGDPIAEVWTRAEIWERKQLDRVREMMRRHEFEVLLVHAAERLAMGHHLGLLQSEAEFHGVRIEFVKGQIDTSTVKGQLELAVQGIGAVQERENTRERTQRGRDTVRQAGRPLPGPRARYGLKWVYVTVPGPDPDAPPRQIKDRWEMHPQTGPVVLDLFRWALDGRTLRWICAELHRRGTRSPTGLEWWRPGVVAKILADPVYTGYAAANRWQLLKIKNRGQPAYKTQRQRPMEDHWALKEGTAPRMIDRADFDAVQALLQRNKAQASRNAKWPDATPLKGYAFCGECGQSLYVHADTRDAPPPEQRGPDWRPVFTFQCRSLRYQQGALRADATRRCVASRSCRTLEAEVWAGLLAKLREPDYRVAAGWAVEAADDRPAHDLDAVRLRLASLDADISRRRAELAALDPALVPRVYGEITAKLEARYAERDAVEAERADREAAVAAAMAQADAWTDLRGWWLEQLERTDPDDRRDPYFALGLRVTVWPAAPERRPDGAPRWEATARLPVEGHPEIRLRAPEGDEASVVSLTPADWRHNGPVPLTWRGAA